MSRTARECNINNILVYALKDQLTEFSYTASIAGEERGEGREEKILI